MKVTVSLYSVTADQVFENVQNTFVSGGLYCIYDGESVYKYPMIHIYNIQESEDEELAPIIDMNHWSGWCGTKEPAFDESDKPTEAEIVDLFTKRVTRDEDMNRCSCGDWCRPGHCLNVPC